MSVSFNPLRSGLNIDPASGGLTDFWGLQSVGLKNHRPPDKVEICEGGREREVVLAFLPFHLSQGPRTFTLLSLSHYLGC